MGWTCPPLYGKSKFYEKKLEKLIKEESKIKEEIKICKEKINELKK